MNEFKNSNKLISDMQNIYVLSTKWLISCGLLFLALPSIAQEKSVKLTPVDSLLPMLGGLLVILAFIFGLAYLFKRFTNFSPSSKNIKVLETQMIGTKEKLVIVKVQQQKFLIGVTPNAISQLGELNFQDELKIDEETVDAKAEQINQNQTTVGSPPNFKSVLTNILKNSVGLKTSSNSSNKLAS